MLQEQKDITNFMSCAGQATPILPEMPPIEVRALRLNLIAEEFSELARAYGFQAQVNIKPDPELKPDIVEAFDGIEDLLVVTVGAGVAMGLPLQEGWDEVHSSNMSKFVDGHRREDGKWIKGPSYRKPDLKAILDNVYK